MYKYARTWLYNIIIMIHVKHEDETVLRFSPIEMRRVHALDIHLDHTGLKYSHTDVLIRFENGSEGFVEAISCILETGTYIFHVEDADVSLSVYLSRTESQCINWLKKIVFSFFPNISVRNTYLGKSLLVNPGLLE